MKQFPIMLSLLFAVVCSYGTLQAAPLAAARDTLDQYVIDNVFIEQFDGSQLEGKKIVTYRISFIGAAGEEPVRMHDIRTKGASKSADPIYVIDGKKVPKRKFENLNPAAIKSITIVKNGSQPEVRQYPGWENGVILVETQTPVEASAAKTDDSQVDIGYGMADSHDLSYSVASVKSDDKEVYTNMYDYLRGKVAGVQVRADNTIIIRGKTTMNSSTEPLILVDGVEITDLNNVNPHDVYSVDVLKDASASIYGLKGANGVILITTKMNQQAKRKEAAATREAKAVNKSQKSQ